jgi:hypothetical protein
MLIKFVEEVCWSSLLRNTENNKFEKENEPCWWSSGGSRDNLSVAEPDKWPVSGPEITASAVQCSAVQCSEA